MVKFAKTKSFFNAGAVLAAALVVSACTSQFQTRGNLPDADLLAEVIPGEVHARDVAEILGTPTTFSTFGGESWYYISERVEYFAYMEPEVLERKVLQIKFAKDGMVEWVNNNENPQIRKMQFVQRVTPTAGNEITFFEQIFGNLGRFNSK